MLSPGAVLGQKTSFWSLVLLVATLASQPWVFQEEQRVPLAAPLLWSWTSSAPRDGVGVSPRSLPDFSEAKA